MTELKHTTEGTLDKMFISIIIPVYNDQAGLNRILESIQSQTLPADRFEIIVIDNNSMPPVMLDPKYARHCSIYKCSRPGSYAARNYGVSKSKGDILAFLDADCHAAPGWLKAGVKALLKNDNLIIGGEVLFEKSQKPTAIEQYQYITGFGQQENIAQKGFSATANLFTSAKAFKAVGPFNETLFSGGDREWCWRAFNAGFKIEFSPDAVVFTAARNSLRKAVIQVRRVLGGRKQLYRIKTISEETKQNISPHRGPFQAAKFIFCQNHLTGFDKIKIFCIAVLLKFVQITEKLRLLYGANAERR